MKFTDKSDNLTLISKPPTTCQLGRGICRMIFLYGEIRDLVTDSDKHSTHRADPDNPDLEAELEGLKDSKVEDTKLRYVLCHDLFPRLADNYCQGGNAAILQ